MSDDMFRILPLRALGYSYAVGEALMYVADTGIIDLCYTVGTGFMLTHVAVSFLRPLTGGSPKDVFVSILWEALASAILPTLVVYHTCRLTARFIDNKDIPPVVRRWAPPIMGLLLIPYIMEPLDIFVDTLLLKAFL